jgi:hypothetical protein
MSYQNLVPAEFRPTEQLTWEEGQRWDAHEQVMATAFAAFREQTQPRRYEDLWLVRQATYLQLKGLELRHLKYIFIVTELIDDFEQPPDERAEYQTVLMLGYLWQQPLGNRPQQKPPR